jgi:CheY-like chemotaxis protein
MDGFEATRQLHAHFQGSARPPILALSASVLDEDREQCLEAGMDAALAKPLQRAVLAAALSHWVDRRVA